MAVWESDYTQAGIIPRLPPGVGGRSGDETTPKLVSFPDFHQGWGEGLGMRLDPSQSHSRWSGNETRPKPVSFQVVWE